MLINIWWVGCKLYKNPITSYRITRRFIVRFTKLMGAKKLVRAFKVDGKYHWDMFNPAWPSKGFNSFFRAHLLEEKQLASPQPMLRRLIVAITKRCPLQCAHCSEAATLYNKDVLSLHDFNQKIDKFVAEGVGQIVYSGGEPLSRLKDLLEMLKRYNGKCDQWIYTSAFGLTYEMAMKLKTAGLNGAAISLDHFSEEGHNSFRGNKKSFYWVIEGIKNLHKAGVFVSINVCPTKELIAIDGVEKIIELAKENNVAVVNILEPRAVGNFEGKEVEFESMHYDQMKAISSKYNFNKELFDYPTVLFPAGYRDQLPCGGGRSYLLLDYDGTLYPCPFCKVKMPEVKPEQVLCKAS